MPVFIYSILVLCMSVNGMRTEQQSNDAVSITLFDFESVNEASWRIVNDGVMGGSSKGDVAIEDGLLRFSGTLVTQGGGFTSVRTSTNLDLASYDGLELRIRGGGRTFEVEIDDSTRRRGRNVSRRASFDTNAEWAMVRIPFSGLRTSVFGQAVRASPIDLTKVTGIGLYILDGKDGPFILEVDMIRTYREDGD